MPLAHRILGCAWVAEVARFCRTMHDCAGQNPANSAGSTGRDELLSRGSLVRVQHGSPFAGPGARSLPPSCLSLVKAAHGDPAPPRRFRSILSVYRPEFGATIRAII